MGLMNQLFLSVELWKYKNLDLWWVHLEWNGRVDDLTTEEESNGRLPNGYIIFYLLYVPIPPKPRFWPELHYLK